MLSAQEYLAGERQATIKSEFYRGEIFAMAGGSPMHSLIAANFSREAGNGFKGSRCNVFNSDLRVRVSPSGLYTYPDASIICGELEFDDNHQDTVTNPTILVEVLSDSTEKYDRGTKSTLYRQIPSLKELILISQNEAYVGCFVRQDRGGWLLHEVLDLSGTIEFSSLPISIALSEIYRGVTFPQQRLQ